MLLGDSALHLAVMASNRDSITRLLIENEADLNIINKNGLTPLELAIDKGNPFKYDKSFFLNKGLIKMARPYSIAYKQ